MGSVRLLYRFPVKGTAGQALSRAEINPRGLVGDREWAGYTADGGIASGKTTRRFRKVEGLMAWRSTVAGAASGAPPELLAPGGAAYRVTDPAASQALSRGLGQPLQLRREAATAHHDESPLHLLTTSSLRSVGRLVGAPVDAGRLRANIVLDTEGAGFPEDVWSGAELAVGPDVVLRLGPGMPRCVMVDRPQAEVTAGPPILQALGRGHHLLLGLQAEVLRSGSVSLGDQARLTFR